MSDAHLSRSVKDAVGRIAELERRTGNLPARWARPMPAPRLEEMRIVEYMIPFAGTSGSGGGSGSPTFIVAKCQPVVSGDEAYVLMAEHHTPFISGRAWAGSTFLAMRPKEDGFLANLQVQIDAAVPPTIITPKWVEVPVRPPIRWGTLVADWTPGEETITLTPLMNNGVEPTGHADVVVSLLGPYVSDIPRWCGYSAGERVPYIWMIDMSETTVRGRFVVWSNPLPKSTEIGHVLQNTRDGAAPWYQMQAFTLYA